MSDISANDGSDPYRYGPPPVTAGPRQPTGKAILTSSWRLLKQDRELIALPVLGSVFGVLAFVVLFLPGAIIAFGSDGDARVPIYLFGFLGALAASVITIFFQAALVVGVYQRADGLDPTIRGTIAGAWRLRRQILGWALLTTTVGAAIRAVEQRLGIFGRLLGFLGGIAWAIATFFVVPVIVAEGVGPVDALKRSASTIRDRWGTSVRTTLRFGVIQFALMIVPFVVIVLGVVMVMSADGDAGGTTAGLALAVIGGLALIALGIVFGAISTYARSLIYRWATGRPVPGIDTALFDGAFRSKRDRR